MKRVNVFSMYRELEVEREKSRAWAARWKGAAKDWEERAGLWWKDYEKALAERDEALQEKHRAWASLDHAIEENRRVEREREELKQQLEALRKVADAARNLVNNLPPGEIEIARKAWGNTNARIISEARMALVEASGGVNRE